MTEFKEIAKLDNEIEARLLGAALEQEGVPHVLRSYGDPAYVGIFQLQRGWGVVIGPAEEEARILAVLAGLQRGGGEAGPAGHPDDTA